MIVFVSIDTFNCVVLPKVVFNKKVKDFCVYWNLRQTNEDSSSDLLNLNLVEPRVLSDIRDLKSLFWVCVQYLCDQVS
jgi:hypothetical protein